MVVTRKIFLSSLIVIIVFSLYGVCGFCGHYDVKLTDEEMHRITLWLDCNSNYFGEYHQLDKQTDGQLIMPELF